MYSSWHWNKTCFFSSTGTGKRRKKRDLPFEDHHNKSSSVDEEEYLYPFLEEMAHLGYVRMEDPECQKKIFCQMANYGKKKEMEEEEDEEEHANAVQRGMRYIAEW